MTLYEWDYIKNGVRALNTSGHALTTIRGFVLVRPVDVDRLKLLDRGFEHIAKALAQSLSDKEKTVYSVWKESWPAANNSYVSSTYPWMEELCAIYRNTNSPLNTWLSQLLLKNEMLGLVQSRIAAYSYHRDIYHGYVNLHAISVRLGVDLIAPHCTKETTKAYNAKYPNIEFLSPKLLSERLTSLSQDSQDAETLRAGLELLLAKKS